MDKEIKIPLSLIVIFIAVIFFTGSLCGYMSGYLYRDMKTIKTKNIRYQRHDYIIHGNSITHNPNCTCGWNI